MSRNRVRDALIATDVSHTLRFSLEFSAVILLFFVLMGLAARSYDSFDATAQIAEAFPLSTTLKADLVAYHAQHGHWPASANELPVEPLDTGRQYAKYVDHIELRPNGVLNAVFHDGEPVAFSLRGRRITFRPVHASGDTGTPIFWLCANNNAPPGTIREGTDETDAPVSQLPYNCREK